MIMDNRDRQPHASKPMSTPFLSPSFPSSLPHALPSEHNAYLADHVNLMRYSLNRLVGQDFPLEGELPQSDAAFAAAIFQAPFIVVSHNTATDPIFNYGNRTALALFEMTWDEFTALPSRQSAEPSNRQERSRLLQAVTTQGYISNYQGIRISKIGRRFWLENAIVWNLLDHQGQYCGQAAVCSQWTYL